MIISLFTALLAAGSALTILTLISNIEFMENLFFRVIAGGSVGGLSQEYLSGVTPTLSFYETCLNGDFGFGGYAAVVTTGLLMIVWIYNIFNYRQVVV